MKMENKILLRKKAIIETINDELKNHCQVEHTRHRSVNNFTDEYFRNSFSILLFPKKTSLNLRSN